MKQYIFKKKMQKKQSKSEGASVQRIADVNGKIKYTNFRH